MVSKEMGLFETFGVNSLVYLAESVCAGESVQGSPSWKLHKREENQESKHRNIEIITIIFQMVFLFCFFLLQQGL